MGQKVSNYSNVCLVMVIRREILTLKGRALNTRCNEVVGDTENRCYVGQKVNWRSHKSFSGIRCELGFLVHVKYHTHVNGAKFTRENCTQTEITLTETNERRHAECNCCTIFVRIVRLIVVDSVA